MQHVDDKNRRLHARCGIQELPDDGCRFQPTQQILVKPLIDCNLDYAIFTHLKLRGSVFRRCRLFDATFDESDLTAVSFDECNLERTSFYHCNLEKTDFSTACNYTINPNDCKLKKTIFSENGLRGLVSHLNIIIKD